MIADLQGRAEFSADDLRPYEICVNARLQSLYADPGLHKHLAELVRAHSGPAGNGSKRGLDLALWHLGDIALAELDLEFIVDQLVEHFLTRRRFLRGKLDQARAVRDIQRGDRIAVDQCDDLRMSSGLSCQE